jgi:hypothetical protein
MSTQETSQLLLDVSRVLLALAGLGFAMYTTALVLILALPMIRR